MRLIRVRSLLFVFSDVGDAVALAGYDQLVARELAADLYWRVRFLQLQQLVAVATDRGLDHNAVHAFFFKLLAESEVDQGVLEGGGGPQRVAAVRVDGEVDYWCQMDDNLANEKVCAFKSNGRELVGDSMGGSIERVQ